MLTRPMSDRAACDGGAIEAGCIAHHFLLPLLTISAYVVAIRFFPADPRFVEPTGTRKETDMLWEDFAVALSGIGFTWVVALLVIELPAVLRTLPSTRPR